MIGIDIFGNEVNSIFVEGIELKPIERFDIQIPDDKAESIETVGDAISFIENA